MSGAGRWLGAGWPWAAAAFSGAALALALPPMSQGWIAWVGLGPLLAAVWFRPGRSGWVDAGLGYVAGLAYFWGSFAWLTTVSVAGWFALAFYLALYFAAWSWLAGWGVRDRSFLRSGKNLLVAGWLAAAWSVLEWVRGWLFTGFCWNGAGVPQAGNLALVQFIEFTGALGLTWLVVLGNAIAVITVRRFIGEAARGRLRPHYDFTVTMALAGGAFLFGAKTLLKQELPPAATPKIALVQPNIPQAEKNDPSRDVPNVGRLEKLTRLALVTGPDLVVWPESALPASEEGTRRAIEAIASLRATGTFDLLFGCDDFDAGGSYNAAMFLASGSSRAEVYRKTHLVPFGEYLPFRKSFPLFAWIAGTQVPGDFAAGDGPAIFVSGTAGIRIGPLICFEDTLGEVTRRAVLAGADLLVNVTNDGWFLKSAGAEQHFANARLRAVEHRRPMVRCANTGVTCAIDAKGRITHELRAPSGSSFVEGFIPARVGVVRGAPLTLYARWGDWFAWLCVAVGAGGACAVAVRRRAAGGARENGVR